MRKPPIHWPVAAVLLTAAFLTLQSLWIPAKAVLAQWLLEQAWQRSLAGAADPRPWPWADTTPAGLLEIPRLGIRQIILDGNNGRNLAFGPTYLNHGQNLGNGDTIVSGHKDTHFAFLQDLKQGDELIIQNHYQRQTYQVEWVEVVDSRYQSLTVDHSQQRLTLVTCYPFDSMEFNGPERFVITALPIKNT